MSQIKENNPYFIALKKLFLANIILFCSLSLIIFYLHASSEEKKFKEIAQYDHFAIDADLRVTQTTYKRQLEFLKAIIERKNNNLQRIKKLLAERNGLFMDTSHISFIAVTDRDLNIILLDQSYSPNESPQIPSPGRNFEALKKYPDEIILGKHIKGIKTRTPFVSLATGIKDKESKMVGSIILGFNLENFLESTTQNTLLKVYFSNQLQVVDSYAYDIFLDSSVWLYIYKIISPFSTSLSLFKYNKFLDKYVYFTYDLDNIRSLFYEELIEYLILMLLVFSVVDAITYFYILTPLKPAISMLNKLDNMNSKDTNIFKNLTNLALFLDSNLKEQQLIHKKQQKQLVELMNLSNHSIISASESLVEDIDDIILKQNNSFLCEYKEFLEEIKKRTISNEINVQATTNFCSEICDSVNKNCKEVVDIYSLLMETTISKKLVVEKLHFNTEENSIVSNHFDNISQYSFRFILYKKLFYLLVEEILNYQNNTVILTQVKLKANSIDFIFDHHNDSIIEDFNLNLMRCVIIGLVNNIRIQCLYISKQVIINCLID